MPLDYDIFNLCCVHCSSLVTAQLGETHICTVYIYYSTSVCPEPLLMSLLLLGSVLIRVKSNFISLLHFTEKLSSNVKQRRWAVGWRQYLALVLRRLYLVTQKFHKNFHFSVYKMGRRGNNIKSVKVFFKYMKNIQTTLFLCSIFSRMKNSRWELQSLQKTVWQT